MCQASIDSPICSMSLVKISFDVFQNCKLICIEYRKCSSVCISKIE